MPEREVKKQVTHFYMAGKREQEADGKEVKSIDKNEYHTRQRKTALQETRNNAFESYPCHKFVKRRSLYLESDKGIQKTDRPYFSYYERRW